MRNKTKFQYGMFGGALVVSLFLIFLFSVNLFNYRIQITKLYINTSNIGFEIDENSFFDFDLNARKILYEDLNSNKLILTPQEYTNNVVSYYNSLLLILSVMLAAFSILTFVYLKSQSKDLIQDGLQSDQFKDDVSEILIGKAESRFREVLVELEDKLRNLEDKIALIDQMSPDENESLELEE